MEDTLSLLFYNWFLEKKGLPKKFNGAN